MRAHRRQQHRDPEPENHQYERRTRPHPQSRPPVIGDVLVLLDTYHLSATYAATLARWLERRLPRV